jgi:hypothetical protein
MKFILAVVAAVVTTSVSLVVRADLSSSTVRGVGSRSASGLVGLVCNNNNVVSCAMVDVVDVIDDAFRDCCW